MWEVLFVNHTARGIAICEQINLNWRYCLCFNMDILVWYRTSHVGRYFIVERVDCVYHEEYEICIERSRVPMWICICIVWFWRQWVAF